LTFCVTSEPARVLQLAEQALQEDDLGLSLTLSTMSTLGLIRSLTYGPDFHQGGPGYHVEYIGPHVGGATFPANQEFVFYVFWHNSSKGRS
jgi:hypothetical protein